MLDFVSSLFREGLVPHGYCIAWQPEILWLHVVSDVLIVLAYYSIPLTLLYFVRRRKDFPFRSVLYLFIAFIFACGTTHAIEIVTIWKAAYGLEGLAKAATATISVVTAILLIPLTPKVLALRSPEALEALNKRLEGEIAEREAAENKLQAAYDELEDRVRERTAELSQAKAALEREMAERERDERARRELNDKLRENQRLESLGSMAEGIAHDFNNLLTVITGRAELLRNEPAVDASSAESLDAILNAASTAAGLSGQMLIYAGRGSVESRPLDFVSTIDNLRPLITAAVSNKAAVKYDLQPGLPGIVSDPSQLRQVALNLVVNAAESTNSQAESVRVSIGRTRLADEPPATCEFLFLESDDQECVFLEVADSGGGMDLETQKRIFDPFFSTKFAGRGLGLAVVLGIVRGGGGAIRIQSRPGDGATFRVLLPALSKPVAADAQGQRGAHGSSGEAAASECVLVVDDDDAVRHLLETVLNKAGYLTWSARSGPQALEILSSRPDKFKLIILDLTMPLMSGAEALREIRGRGLETPVILTSGCSADRAEDELEEGRAAAFLGKPFTPIQLLRQVELTLQSAVSSTVSG